MKQRAQTHEGFDSKPFRSGTRLSGYERKRAPREGNRSQGPLNVQSLATVPAGSTDEHSKAAQDGRAAGFLIQASKGLICASAAR